MNNMYAILLFLVFSMSMSSTLCDDGNQEIAMVVEDQTTVHDHGMSQANRVETGIFILENGKVLKLSRKSSPGKNCINLDQPCGVLDQCCDPYYCTGYAWGTCVTTYCVRAGLPCPATFSQESCCGNCFGAFCVG